MLFSLALILFCGFTMGGIMQKFKLPPLLGMMITGIFLGPFTLNLIDPAILNISADLREIALIVILILGLFQSHRKSRYAAAAIDTNLSAEALCALVPHGYIQTILFGSQQIHSGSLQSHQYLH